MKLALYTLSIAGLLTYAATIARPASHQSSAAPEQATSQISQSAGVTLAQFNQLREGMSYSEAVKILGHDGVDTGSGSKHSRSGIKVVQYLWQGNGGGSMTAIFGNGKLVSKAQSGLK